jgi:hypothetical protein
MKNFPLVLLFFAMFALTFTTNVQAKILDLTFSIAAPTDLSKKYNNGQTVSLQAQWASTAGIATPPFAATFKAGGTAIGSVNTSGNTANYSVAAGSLPEGTANTFGVSVIETSVPNAEQAEQIAAGGFIVDRTAPKFALTVTSGAVVSPHAGFNEVTFQFVSDEPLGGAPEFQITPGAWSRPTPTITEAAPFSVNIYKLTVPAGTSGGVYTIKAIGKDATEPAGSANEGAGTVSFTVDAIADGAPVIAACSPSSPVRVDSVTLSGSLAPEAGTQKVEILEGGTVKGSTSIPANTGNWSITVSALSEGSHKLVARAIDSFGNTSASSAEFTVVVDKTAPQRPSLIQGASPVKDAKVRVIGSGTIDTPLNSVPIKVFLFRDGTQVAQTTANADGSFTFADVPLNSGNNVFFAQAADTTNDSSGNAGNQTAFSAPMMVVLDQKPPVIVGGGVVISGVGATTPPAAPTLFTGPEAFSPPMSRLTTAPLLFRLPFSQVQEKYLAGTSGWLNVVSSPELPPTALPLEQDENSFFVSFFPPSSHLKYFFEFRDPAGNISRFPSEGTLSWQNKRLSNLRVSHRPVTITSGTDADEWPVALFGLPPLDRLLAYRRIETEPDLVISLEQFLTAHQSRDLVEIHTSDGRSSTPTAVNASDIDLLSENRLPLQRCDLLLEELRCGDLQVDPQRQPVPETPNPAFKPVWDAIQFQRLHDLSPESANRAPLR